MDEQELMLALLRELGNDLKVLRAETRTDILRVHARLDEIQRTANQQGESVAALRIQAGVWGALAGLLPAAGTALWFLFRP